MGNQNNSLVASTKHLQLMLRDNFKAITSVLPKGMDPGRFCRMAINSVIRNPKLAECNRATFVMGVVNAAEAGLELDGEQAALVPYKGRVQYQPMYQGLMKLARSSGEILTFRAEVVREGDEFSYSKGLEPELHHVPKAKLGAKLTHAYAVAKLKDGEVQFEVVTAEEVEKVRKASPAGASKEGPWTMWPDTMWKKTAIRRLCKYLPKSPQMDRALSLDDMAMAGKPQPPMFADMDGATIDVEEVAGEPQGEGEIRQPQEKKPDPEPASEPKDEKPKSSSKLKKGAVSVTPEKVDHKDLVEECLTLERELAPSAIEKAKQMIGIDEAADLEMESDENLAQLLHLYKAAMND